MVEPSRWRPARRIEGQLQCRIRAHRNKFVLLRVSRCERSLCTAYGCVHGKTMRLDRRDGIRNNRWNGQYMCRWWCDDRADVPVPVRSRILHRRFRYDHVSAERSRAYHPVCVEYQCPAISQPAFETQASATCTGGGAAGQPTCQFSARRDELADGVSDTITCGYDGVWPAYPTCVASSCSSATIPNSDRDTENPLTGVTGDILTVTCDLGYTGPNTLGTTSDTGGTVECQSSGTFTTINCTANRDPFIAFSQFNVWDQNPLTGNTGDSVQVTCMEHFTTGGGHATCLPTETGLRLSAPLCLSVVITTPKHDDAASPAAIAVPDRTALI